MYMQLNGHIHVQWYNVLYTTQCVTMCAHMRLGEVGGVLTAQFCTVNNLEYISLPLLLLLGLHLSLLAQLELPQLHLKDQTGVGWDTTLDTLCSGQR